MASSEAAVYIDSPIPSAVRQVAPFYGQGVFSNEKTPLFMRRRPGTGYGVFSGSDLNGVHVTQVNGKVAKRLPVQRGGTVFYAFNGQGNLHTVANRSYRHVLVLHGESNKRASARPAARLYDFVCVAGGVAIDRYVSAGIFRRKDVEEQRLIQVGDTFVQQLEGYSVDVKNGDAVLYAPTWEGFGGTINNYSSLSAEGGPMVKKAMEILGRRTLIIRPHPYLGMLKPGMIRELMRCAIDVGQGRRVLFDLSDANLLVRSAVRAAMISRCADIGIATGTETLSFCLCDVSAMESVCLKAHLPHFIMSKNFTAPEKLAPLYAVKSASTANEVTDRLPSYMSAHAELDERHRQEVFAVSHPDFLSPEGGVRFDRLQKILSESNFWG